MDAPICHLKLNTGSILILSVYIYRNKVYAWYVRHYGARR